MSWKEDLMIRGEGELIKNPYSEQECYLVPEACAVYDFIKGSELLANIGISVASNSKLMREALEYFQEKWPKEYIILLD
jgi:hypothetical protein